MLKGDELFLKVHQLQVELIKNTTKATCSEYRSELSRLLEYENVSLKFAQSTEVIHFTEFLVFPLLTALKKLLDQKPQQQNKSQAKFSDINEILLSSITIVLNKKELFSLNLFEDILSVCSILLSKAIEAPDMHRQLESQLSESDEFYIAASSLINSLFKRSGESLLEHFYRLKNLPTMGILVAAFINIIRRSQSLQVRLQVLETFKSFLQYDKNNAGTQTRIGVLFASFLPGISIGLVQNFLLVQNLKTLNHKIICSTLELLSFVISHVFSDELSNTTTAKKRIQVCYGTDGEALSANLKSLLIDRSVNSEWVKLSSQKLLILVDRLFNTLINHESTNVQLSLVNFCSQITAQCYFSLNEHLRKFLRVLVTFAASDDNRAVVLQAVEALKAIEKKEKTWVIATKKFNFKDITKQITGF